MYFKLFILVMTMIAFAGCAATHRHPNMTSLKQTPKITQAHYRVYDSEGHPAALKDVITAAGTHEAVFVGESHHDPVAHFLQSELFKGIYIRYDRDADPARQRQVVLSLEMFERDVQIILDEYLGDLIPERHFLGASRPWGNYQTDYRPLIEFARENKIPVIAANAPRRYVNRVSRQGRTSLSDLSPTAKSWLPPLPFPCASPEYRAKFESLGKRTSSHPMPRKKKKGAEADKNRPAYHDLKMMSQIRTNCLHLIDAQTLWDATMAFSVSDALAHDPGALVLNINGKFHSEQGLGIPEHLSHYRPDTRILTVTILPESCFPNFDEKFKGFGDFVIIADPEIRSSEFEGEKSKLVQKRPVFPNFAQFQKKG